MLTMAVTSAMGVYTATVFARGGTRMAGGVLGKVGSIDLGLTAVAATSNKTVGVIVLQGALSPSLSLSLSLSFSLSLPPPLSLPPHPSLSLSPSFPLSRTGAEPRRV